MGFETENRFCFKFFWHGLNIPYGIWNRPCKRLKMQRLKFEHTLWDLKRGLAYLQAPAFRRFEHTLWDLKLIHFSKTRDQLLSRLNIPYGIWNAAYATRMSHDTTGLNIPYGIWNLYYEFRQTQSFRFEHTLWDLKLFWASCACGELNVVWTYPMGFETFV